MEQASETKKHIACLACRSRKLKCDGEKPRCSKCRSRDTECVYAASKKAGPRRGYVKSLEQRVRELEMQLNDRMGQKGYPIINDSSPDTLDGSKFGVPYGGGGGGGEGHIKNESSPSVGSSSHVFDSSPDRFTYPTSRDTTTNSSGKSYAVMDGVPIQQHPHPHHHPSNQSQHQPQHMSSKWLTIEGRVDEPLPAPELIEELMEVYFSGVNRLFPVIDEYKFRLQMTLHPAGRPKIYLQYALFMTAAWASGKYTRLAEVFYQRTCKYIERAVQESGRTGGSKDNIMSLQFIQGLILLATYEYRSGMFPQAWLRIGSAVRGCFMQNLHLLDAENYDTIDVDRTDRDEGRRVVWLTYIFDRTASGGTGWPCSMSSDDIYTRIPLDDDLFLAGNPTNGVRLDFAIEHPEILAQHPTSRFLVYVLYSDCQGRLNRLLKQPMSDAWLSEFHKLDRLLNVLQHSLPPLSHVFPHQKELTIHVHMLVQTAILCLNKCAIGALQRSTGDNSEPPDTTPVDMTSPASSRDGKSHHQADILKPKTPWSKLCCKDGTCDECAGTGRNNGVYIKTTAPDMLDFKKLSESERLSQLNFHELIKRCTSAASEITLLIRMSKGMAGPATHPFTMFTIYTCAKFFLAAVQSNNPDGARFKTYFDFLMTMLKVMSSNMPLAGLFLSNIVRAQFLAEATEIPISQEPTDENAPPPPINVGLGPMPEKPVDRLPIHLTAAQGAHFGGNWYHGSTSTPYNGSSTPVHPTHAAVSMPQEDIVFTDEMFNGINQGNPLTDNFDWSSVMTTDSMFEMMATGDRTH